MISAVTWLPPAKYGFILQLDDRLGDRPVLNFEQRKIITYLGALGAIVYLIYLSTKQSDNLIWHSYIAKMLKR